MKWCIRDRAEGTFQEVKGSLKVAAGKPGNNPKLQAEGIPERAAGQVQDTIGQARRALGK